MVVYYGHFNLDNDDKDVKFIDINLPYNKLNIQLLANDFITCTKKRRVITDNKDNKSSKPKTN